MGALCSRRRRTLIQVANHVHRILPFMWAQAALRFVHEPLPASNIAQGDSLLSTSYTPAPRKIYQEREGTATGRKRGIPVGRRPRPQPQEQWQQADGASSTRMTRTATRNRLSHKARHVLILSHSDAFFLPVTFVSAFLKMASKMCGFGHKRAQKIYFFRKFLIAIMSSLRIRAARTDFQDARLRG